MGHHTWKRSFGTCPLSIQISKYLFLTKIVLSILLYKLKHNFITTWLELIAYWIRNEFKYGVRGVIVLFQSRTASYGEGLCACSLGDGSSFDCFLDFIGERGHLIWWCWLEGAFLTCNSVGSFLYNVCVHMWAGNNAWTSLTLNTLSNIINFGFDFECQFLHVLIFLFDLF